MHYGNFTEDNDPYGEHDFGKVVVGGECPSSEHSGRFDTVANGGFGASVLAV